MVEPEVTLFGSKTTTAGQSPDRLVGCTPITMASWACICACHGRRHDG
jgi:hypothetical protein